MRFSPPTAIRRALAAVCLVAATVAAPRPAAAADDLTALLARPVSPGAVALLAGHATQPAAQKRLIEAVRHDDPAVRAVAARVAFVTMSKGAASALIAAVAKEEHVHTGAEQVRALMALLGAPGDAIVTNAVKRLGGPAAVAMAESMARTRPMDIAERVPMLAAAASRESSELGAALATACAQHSSFASEILLAAMAVKNDDLWTAVLEAMRNNIHPVPPDVLLQALKSGEEFHRVRTIWHLFFLYGDGDPITQDVIAAAAPQPIAATATATAAPATTDLTWEAFARELFARRRGTPPAKADWAGMLALPAHKERVATLPFQAFAYLTDDEVKAIGAVDEDRNASRSRRSARRSEWETDKAPGARTQTMRTMPVLAKGLLGDLMAIHGCRASSNLFAAGDIKYRPDGRAQSISILQSQLSQECLAFVRAAMVLTIASVDNPVAPEIADRVMVLFEPAYLACADDPFPPSRPQGADLPFTRAKLTREPTPQYPNEMRRSGMPDLVVALRVLVSHTGCVSSAETLRSVLPAFDLAAIQSMFTSKWQPATLSGQPVDAYVTFSVLFRLR
jgi:Gram-negative bacterial TonB protein C-terminal